MNTLIWIGAYIFFGETHNGNSEFLYSLVTLLVVVFSAFVPVIAVALNGKPGSGNVNIYMKKELKK